MIEIEQNKHINTLVVSPILNWESVCLSPEDRLAEAVGLALSIDLSVIYSEYVKLKEIKPSLYFSKGFIERILPIINEKQVELLIVDAKLSPIQQRNLERELKIKVIDRTALILEIFGERAQTKEGFLQVELAHLTYQRSRLVRSWTHLERQRGGAGFLGGPGETQIEMDRRLIDEKIVRIKKDLEKVKQTREIQRSSRKKVPYPVVALVGYTNAGKSTLFNYLTKSNALAANMLFATLDPTMRKIELPSGQQVILSDTVGFISDLPHELIMSFRATLEEVLNADLILHIRDISNPNNMEQCNDVLNVLDCLGLKDIKSTNNYVEVLNKSDLLPSEDLMRWKNKVDNSFSFALTSAVTGDGCENLLQLIDKKISVKDDVYAISIPVAEGRISSWLYQNGEIIKVENTDTMNIFAVKVSAKNIARFKKMVAENASVSIRKK